MTSEHILWYGRPASQWVEALPVGNGRIGAMVFGGPQRERLQINDGTAWSGTLQSEQAEPRVTAEAAKAAIAASKEAIARGDFVESDAWLRTLQHRYTQSYLPFVDLFLTSTAPAVQSVTSEDPGEYRRTLDMRTALHETRYRCGSADVVRAVFVSAPDDVLVMTVDTDHPDGIDVEMTLSSDLRSIPVANQMSLAGLLLRLPSDISPPVDGDLEPIRYSDSDDASMHGAVAVGWNHDGEDIDTADGASLHAHGVRHAVFYLSTKTTFMAMGVQPEGTAETALAAAQERVAAAAARGVAAVRRRQQDDHARYYERVGFTLERTEEDAALARLPIDERLRRGNASSGGAVDADPGLAQLLFHYGRYLLISSSRPGGLPANLQGIWNDQLQAPWSGNFTTNINVEMNYWLAEVANLSELAEPLFDLIEVLSDRGTETAQRIYAAPGWVAHHNTDPWGYTQPVGRGQHEPRWAFWPLAGAWLVRHLWEHLQFGADDVFAREQAWPAIRGASEFFLSWLVRDADGTYGTAPSTSPENEFRTPSGEVASAATSSAMDLTLIADLFRMTVEIAQRLRIADDAVVAAAAAALPHIPGPAIGRDGTIAEWMGDFQQVDPAHRHLSHLLFAFPGDARLDGELRAAVISSLDARGDEATGWSLAWKIALRARTRQPDSVSALMALFFRDVDGSRGDWIGGLYPNMLVAHPPFQIDGNLGFVAGIVECFVQSHGGRIDLLPAVPHELAAGRLSGVVARPGVEVDLEWSTGGLNVVRLRPLRSAGRGVVNVAYRGVEITVDLSAGRQAELGPEAFAP